jgi:hypothetical protein
MADANVQIPLANAIRALRQELVAAVDEGRDQPVRFALGPVELELRVQISREGGVEGKIAFWVLSLGGKGTQSSESAHTIRLSLTPMLASETDDQGPLIVGSPESRRPD